MPLPGIDTPQLEHVRILKVNIRSERRGDAVGALRALGTLLQRPGATDTAGTPCSALVTSVVGFSARFFRGVRSRRNESPATVRFGIQAPIPADLGAMRARGDDHFSELRGEDRIAAKESDLIVLLESDGERAVSELACRILELDRSVALHAAAEPYAGRVPADGRGCLGVRDPISNLQDIAREDPARYRRLVYVHDGDAGSPAYDGGTYLVYRRYILNLSNWLSDTFTVRDRTGRARLGPAARELALGRTPGDDRVVDRETGVRLAALPDEAQASRAFDESHIRKANPRGRGTTNFGSTVLVDRDARILRRSAPFTDTDPRTGARRDGLHFLCFQRDITRSGFQFIHNEWLMSRFMGARDALLSPEADIVEPVDGCYYFVPPRWRYPGARFFS